MAWTWAVSMASSTPVKLPSLFNQKYVRTVCLFVFQIKGLNLQGTIFNPHLLLNSVRIKFAKLLKHIFIYQISLFSYNFTMRTLKFASLLEKTVVMQWFPEYEIWKVSQTFRVGFEGTYPSPLALTQRVFVGFSLLYHPVFSSQPLPKSVSIKPLLRPIVPFIQDSVFLLRQNFSLHRQT